MCARPSPVSNGITSRRGEGRACGEAPSARVRRAPPTAKRTHAHARRCDARRHAEASDAGSGSMAGSRVEDAAGIDVIATKQPPLPVPRQDVIFDRGRQIEARQHRARRPPCRSRTTARRRLPHTAENRAANVDCRAALPHATRPRGCRRRCRARARARYEARAACADAAAGLVMIARRSRDRPSTVQSAAYSPARSVTRV